VAQSPLARPTPLLSTTETRRSAKNERNRRYRQNNPERVKQARREYWHRNRENIRIRRQNNVGGFLDKQRLRHLEEYSDLKQRRQLIVEKLGSQCYICGSKGILILHHLSYKNGNPYKNYERTRAKKEIIKEAESDPSNFKLLCSKHHIALTLIKTKDHLLKLMELVPHTH